MPTRIQGWIATKHKSNGFGEWSISPKAFFIDHQRIPDGHAQLETPGLEEVMDHTLRATDGSSGRELLEQLGFEIIDNPIWYFDNF